MSIPGPRIGPILDMHSTGNWHGEPDTAFVKCATCEKEITTNGHLSDKEVMTDFKRRGWDFQGFGQWKCPEHAAKLENQEESRRRVEKPEVES